MLSSITFWNVKLLQYITFWLQCSNPLLTSWMKSAILIILTSYKLLREYNIGTTK